MVLRLLLVAAVEVCMLADEDEEVRLVRLGLDGRG